MSDLIERQAAIEAIEEMQIPIMRSIFPEEQFVFKGMSEALSAIKDLPSAQPERCEDCENFSKTRLLIPQPEIIRCKDCKHLYEDNKCPLRTWWTHTEDDFCSYAERRIDE